MSDLMISQPLICWGPLWFKCLWASLFANFPTSYFSPKLSAFLKVKPSLSIELEPENRVCFLWFSSAALEEALIVYDLWIHLEWERTEAKGNKEVGKTTIERLRGFFFFFLGRPSLAGKLRAAPHCPSHRKLCGALPSGPSSMRIEFFLLLLVSPLNPQPFSLFTCLTQFYVSLALSFHILQCLPVPSVYPHPSPCHFLWSP